MDKIAGERVYRHCTCDPLTMAEVLFQKIINVKKKCIFSFFLQKVNLGKV